MTKRKNIRVPIKVTEEYIRDSMRGNPTSCMVHDAIVQQLQLPNTAVVSTNYGSSRIVTKDGALTIRHGSIGPKIRGWDMGRETEEFEFEASLPPDWRERLGL